MKVVLLALWLILDVAVSVFFIGGGVYLAIWRHCSGWWVVLGIIISGMFGGKQLYLSLRSYVTRL